MDRTSKSNRRRFLTDCIQLGLTWSALNSLEGNLVFAQSSSRSRPKGVSFQVEKSIHRGLRFLARTQNGDGSWNNNGGYGRYPTAMTALAGMAFLGSGSTSTRGPYATNIRKATDFLLNNSQSSGLIATPAESGNCMHGHGFATMFLAEVYGNEESHRRQFKIRDALHKAIRLTSRSQSRAGGWLYSPNQDADEGSVTVTQIQALRACRNAGVHVPPSTIKRAIQYIERTSRPDGSINYSLQSNWGPRPAITAAAVATLYNAGKYDSPLAARSMRFCDQNLSVYQTQSGHYFYAHLYYAQAKYQQGGSGWSNYFKEISDTLLSRQQGDGAWMGDHVGTTYGTSLALTILQLPYQYVSIYQR